METDHDIICRICHGEDGDENGRLIANVCSCKGSMKYVHLVCLNTWRRTRPENYFTCINCKQPYKLKKSTICVILSSPKTALWGSLILYILLIFAVGCVGRFVLSIPRRYLFKTPKCEDQIPARSESSGNVTQPMNHLLQNRLWSFRFTFKQRLSSNQQLGIMDEKQCKVSEQVFFKLTILERSTTHTSGNVNRVCGYQFSCICVCRYRQDTKG